MSGLTPDSLDAVMRSLAIHRPQTRLMFVSIRTAEMIERWARTKTVARMRNHSLYELDGRMFWQRRDAIEGSRGFWPRYDPEDCGYSPRQIYNRHWRKRGYKS